MYLLDTNTLIYFFKGFGNVASRLLSEPHQHIGIPAVVLFELETGIAKSQSPARRRKQLEQLVSQVNVVPFGIREARHAARIRAMLETAGTPIGPYDILIAATATANKGILVTHNVKEFRRIRELSTEDWY
jgi:tRNA(fMet)-specific endonuclease VapC